MNQNGSNSFFTNTGNSFFNRSQSTSFFNTGNTGNTGNTNSIFQRASSLVSNNNNTFLKPQQTLNNFQNHFPGGMNSDGRGSFKCPAGLTQLRGNRETLNQYSFSLLAKDEYKKQSIDLIRIEDYKLIRTGNIPEDAKQVINNYIRCGHFNPALLENQNNMNAFQQNRPSFFQNNNTMGTGTIGMNNQSIGSNSNMGGIGNNNMNRQTIFFNRNGQNNTSNSFLNNGNTGMLGNGQQGAPYFGTGINSSVGGGMIGNSNTTGNSFFTQSRAMGTASAGKSFFSQNTGSGNSILQSNIGGNQQRTFFNQNNDMNNGNSFFNTNSNNMNSRPGGMSFFTSGQRSIQNNLMNPGVMNNNQPGNLSFVTQPQYLPMYSLPNNQFGNQYHMPYPYQMPIQMPYPPYGIPYAIQPITTPTRLNSNSSGGIQGFNIVPLGYSEGDLSIGETNTQEMPDSFKNLINKDSNHLNQMYAKTNYEPEDSNKIESLSRSLIQSVCGNKPKYYVIKKSTDISVNSVKEKEMFKYGTIKKFAKNNINDNLQNSFDEIFEQHVVKLKIIFHFSNVSIESEQEINLSKRIVDFKKILLTKFENKMAMGVSTAMNVSNITYNSEILDEKLKLTDINPAENDIFHINIGCVFKEENKLPHTPNSKKNSNSGIAPDREEKENVYFKNDLPEFGASKISNRDFNSTSQQDQNELLKNFNSYGAVNSFESKDLTDISLLPTCTKFQINPSLYMISRMSAEELQKIKNLKIWNEFGKITFPGFTDILNVNIDECVSISRHSIEVYPDEKYLKNNSKPPIGKKLNKQAILKFKNIEPPSSTNDPNEIQLFISKLKKGAEIQNAIHLSYSPEKKIWKIQVEHFTRYYVNLDDVVDDIIEEEQRSTDMSTIEDYELLNSFNENEELKKEIDKLCKDKTSLGRLKKAIKDVNNSYEINENLARLNFKSPFQEEKKKDTDIIEDEVCLDEINVFGLHFLKNSQYDNDKNLLSSMIADLKPLFGISQPASLSILILQLLEYHVKNENKTKEMDAIMYQLASDFDNCRKKKNWTPTKLCLVVKDYLKSRIVKSVEKNSILKNLLVAFISSSPIEINFEINKQNALHVVLLWYYQRISWSSKVNIAIDISLRNFSATLPRCKCNDFASLIKKIPGYRIDNNPINMTSFLLAIPTAKNILQNQLKKFEEPDLAENKDSPFNSISNFK